MRPLTSDLSFLCGSGPSGFGGSVYNLRVWDYAMTVPQLDALGCRAAGNVIDWDNGFWDVPPSLAQTDAALSCSESLSFGFHLILSAGLTPPPHPCSPRACLCGFSSGTALSSHIPKARMLA